MYNERKFREKLVGAGLTVDKLAGKIGINQATLYRKIKGTSEFTRIEMQIIQNVLHLSREDLHTIFFLINLRIRKKGTGRMTKHVITKNFRERVKYEMGIRGIKPIEMAATVQMAERTFYTRLANPDRFTLGEVDAMARKMHLESNDLLFGNLSQRRVISQGKKSHFRHGTRRIKPGAFGNTTSNVLTMI